MARPSADPATADPARFSAEAVGRELHLLIDDLVSTSPDANELAAIGRHLVAARRELERHERSRYWERGGTGDDYRRVSPFRGPANAVAPHLDVVVEGADADVQAHGSVVVPAIYEGPPGCVHGGFLAGLFDELMGATQANVGPRAGVTGRLTVRYRRPTPIGQRLDFTCSINRVTSAFTDVRAQCRCAGELTAEAEGLFLRPRPLPKDS